MANTVPVYWFVGLSTLAMELLAGIQAPSHYNCTSLQARTGEAFWLQCQCQLSVRDPEQCMWYWDYWGGVYTVLCVA